MNDNRKINDILVIKYNVEVVTGLHIGGNIDSYGIGGIDSPVIKNPINNQPIIPGSSIKGKLRYLLENVKTNDYDCTSKKEMINEMFGTGQESKNKEYKGITRVIFRDLSLTENSKKELESHLGEGYFTEIKAENTINKATGKANPRFQERVPKGAIFEGECIINRLDNDCKIDEYYKLLNQGFKLLEQNYLGGSGSRGYGKVKINIEAKG